MYDAVSVSLGGALSLPIWLRKMTIVEMGPAIAIALGIVGVALGLGVALQGVSLGRGLRTILDRMRTKSGDTGKLDDHPPNESLARPSSRASSRCRPAQATRGQGGQNRRPLWRRRLRGPIWLQGRCGDEMRHAKRLYEVFEMDRIGEVDAKQIIDLVLDGRLSAAALREACQLPDGHSLPLKDPYYSSLFQRANDLASKRKPRVDEIRLAWQVTDGIGPQTRVALWQVQATIDVARDQVQANLIRERAWQGTTISHVDQMSGTDFELFVSGMLRNQGYRSTHTGRPGDKGVDVVITDTLGVRTAVQCKRYSGLVGEDAVCQALSGMDVYFCQRAMVVTNSDLTWDARTLASSHDVQLVERSDLRLWIAENRKFERTGGAIPSVDDIPIDPALDVISSWCYGLARRTSTHGWAVPPLPSQPT